MESRNVKIVTILVSLPMFLTIFTPMIASDRIFSSSVMDYFAKNFAKKIWYIKASSPYDYGFKVGKLFRLPYFLLEKINSLNRKNTHASEESFEEQIKNMETYSPLLLEELKGLSAGLNIKMKKLMTLCHVFDSLTGKQCTVTLSTGNATKNHDTFLTFNVDTEVDDYFKILFLLFLRAFTYKIWVADITSMDYKYAFIGIPILYEWPIINEEGLSFAATGLILTDNKSRYIDEGPGMSTYMLERLTMMTCKNVSEVAELWKRTERASGTYSKWPHFWDNSMPVWCDREGGILSIEQTHNYIITVFGNSTEITGAPEGILWHANHHQWLNPNLTGSIQPQEYISSMYRADRAYDLLIENYGNITLDVCKNITRDYQGGSKKDSGDSRDICKYPDKEEPGITAFAWIIHPQDYSVYLTHTIPSNSKYTKYDFSEIFSK